MRFFNSGRALFENACDSQMFRLTNCFRPHYFPPPISLQCVAAEHDDGQVWRQARHGYITYMAPCQFESWWSLQGQTRSSRASARMLSLSSVSIWGPDSAKSLAQWYLFTTSTVSIAESRVPNCELGHRLRDSAIRNGRLYSNHVIFKKRRIYFELIRSVKFLTSALCWFS